MGKRDECIWEKDTNVYEKKRTVYLNTGIYLYEMRSIAMKNENFIYEGKKDLCIGEKETCVHEKGDVVV